MKKYVVEYKLQVPMGGVRLTGGRFQRAFENNVAFLKGFDLDRMLYWSVSYTHLTLPTNSRV